MTNPFDIIDARLSTIESLLIELKLSKNELFEAATGDSTARKILTLDEFCEYASLSKQTVYKKTSKGEIPHSKRGKRLFFEKAKIDEWLLENRVGSKTEIGQQADKHLERLQTRRAQTRH